MNLNIRIFPSCALRGPGIIHSAHLLLSRPLCLCPHLWNEVGVGILLKSHLVNILDFGIQEVKSRILFRDLYNHFLHETKNIKTGMPWESQFAEPCLED